jgi:hypothetical protein
MVHIFAADGWQCRGGQMTILRAELTHGKSGDRVWQAVTPFAPSVVGRVSELSRLAQDGHWPTRSTCDRRRFGVVQTLLVMP